MIKQRRKEKAMLHFSYYSSYIPFIIPLLLCMLLSLYASAKVKSTYKKYGKVYTKSGYDGYNAAHKLLRANGVLGISIGKVSGELTDHYSPSKDVVNLSDSTYDSPTVAAVAVAAHEIGHVMQHEDGYAFYKLRTALVPITNIGTSLAMPLVLIGLLLDSFVKASKNSELGFQIAMIGVILYGLSFLFALVTYPVELNASRRARQMLLDTGILDSSEIPAAKKVLSAAALTYLASLLTSLVYFLRFLFYVLRLFGKRRD